ncbi:MAG TPA: murein biosynthesis integral membrane protein MurJ [Chthoniobacterales bacterium]|jgi:putative peptidoglycan lipid II flippase|nr:murein biosynthesis integral membrane protein MurJ [Chthoniobacterales bacterium]
MAEQTHRVSTRATGVVGIAVLCSRILGLIREQVFAGLFGAGKNLDAFLMAFRLPNLLRDLFAEGALSTAFITTFSKKIATEGDESAWRLGNRVATLTAVFMSAVTLLGIIFAPQLIHLMTWWSWSPEKTETTILLTRIMFPFILLVSLAALVMGMLNAKNVFGAPAMASSYFNLGSIIGGVVLGYWLDPHFGTRSLIGLSIGTLIGGLWQLSAQFPSLYRVGYSYRPDFHWRDQDVRTVLTLMGPAVIAASAVQVNVLINSGFAARLGDGPVSWLNIAFRLMQLPLGIFGVAVGTVTLPLVSRTAALGDMGAFRSALAHAIRLVTLLTIPAAVGLILLAEPIISVIYEHGRFTAEATRQTAGALQFYAIGLAAYSAVKVLAPAFYALDKRYLPMMVSIFSIITNFILNWFFMFRMNLGHRGLALSTSLVALTNFLLLYIMMRKYAGSLETGALLGLLAKLAIPLALLAGVCWIALETMFYPGAHLPEWQRIFGVLLVIGVAVAVFFGSAFLFRVDEVRDVVDLVRRKFGRGGNQPSA